MTFLSYAVAIAVTSLSFRFVPVLGSITGKGDGLTVAIVLTDLSLLAVVLSAIYCRRSLTFREYLALRPVRPRILLRWIVALVFLFVLIIGIGDLAGISDGDRNAKLKAACLDAYSPFLCLFLMTVMAPITEELVFRGFLFQGLLKMPQGRFWAVAVSSLAFVLAHYSPSLDAGAWGLIQIALLGTLQGLSRLKTGSVYPSMTLHGLSNMGGVALWFI